MDANTLKAIKDQCWVEKHWDKENQRWIDRHIDLNKFADLVIRNCATLVEGFTYLAEHSEDQYEEIDAKDFLLSTIAGTYSEEELAAAKAEAESIANALKVE